MISRLILLFVTFISPGEFIQHSLQKGTVNPSYSCIHHLRRCFLSWDFWDADVFVDIAHGGYAHRPPNKYNLSAFFPLWPLLMHTFGSLFNGSFTTIFVVGLLLANICFYLSLVLLYHLVSTRFDASVAKDTLFLLAMNPYALFFFNGYSESLFLLLCLLMFFFLERDCSLDWWLAGLCGFLAALTRATGIVLVIPFLTILGQQVLADERIKKLLRKMMERNGRDSIGSRQDDKSGDRHEKDPDSSLSINLFMNRFLPMLLIPFGLVLYMIYLYFILRDPFAFSKWEAITWGRHLTFPWVGILNDIRSIFLFPNTFTSNFTDLLFTLIPIAVLLIGWKQLPLHYCFFALMMMLLSLSNPIEGLGYPLASSPRYMLVIFPVAILLALWAKNPRVKSMLMALSVSLFTINALLFLSHAWVA